MRTRICLFFVFKFSFFQAIAQKEVNVDLSVVDATTEKAVSDAQVYSKSGKYIGITSEKGVLNFQSKENKSLPIIVFSYDYEIHESVLTPTNGGSSFTVQLNKLSEELSEVFIENYKKTAFNLKRFKDVEGTAIYAGKKTEVVLVDQVVGNLAANNARQVMSQVVGLNIYDVGDGGLQLSVGGRGLDPNRTANFNTRQNGYDISADVLGYPESYYTPTAESLSEIQVIRGAASLQYGTQFGGLINFKLKEPVKDKELEFVTRNTVGSFGLKTSFNSLSGTKGKFSYYTFFNYKDGDGYRANSNFNSRNFYGYVAYQFSEKTKLSFEGTFLNYLAKQSGGLSDAQFLEDPRQSNRTRNWFEVNWNLYALKFEHKFSENSDFSLNLFALNASRKSLGFRMITEDPEWDPNPFLDPDEQDSNGNFIHARDLMVGEFKNWGAESRWLTRYKLLAKDAVLLIGTKVYSANNTSQQGPGSKGADADFNFYTRDFPSYSSQSAFEYPNFNTAVFAENIFKLSDFFSITPGIRYEYIKTTSDGWYRDNNMGKNVEDYNRFERNIFLVGVGASFKPTNYFESYANLSQNYRSVTFSDIRTISPSFTVAEDITDEKGYTADIGIRGKYRNVLSYDANVFGMLYDGKIGTNFEDRVGWVRDNIGTAVVYGLEALVDWNLKETFLKKNSDYKLNVFVNTAITDSQYTKSRFNGVQGKKVEFIPLVNTKSGVGFGYKNFVGSLQYTYLSEQFTDVTNAPYDPENTITVEGAIPSYDILDFSLAYTYKKIKLEAGINNLLNRSYFTRRATGYPGPGIITSDPRSYYFTMQLKL